MAGCACGARCAAHLMVDDLTGQHRGGLDRRGADLLDEEVREQRDQWLHE